MKKTYSLYDTHVLTHISATGVEHWESRSRSNQGYLSVRLIADAGRRLVKGIGMGVYKLYARLWAWLARPGNVGYGSMTIVENCACGECVEPYIPSAKEDWDAEFYARTLTNVEFVLNPPPYAPQIPGYFPPWEKLKLPTRFLRQKRELWSYRGW